MGSSDWLGRLYFLPLYLSAGLVALWLAIRWSGDRRPSSIVAQVTLVILLTIGQVAGDMSALYPFVRWDMYSGPQPQYFRSYLITDTAGRVTSYPFSLFSRASPWPFEAGIDRAIARCECHETDPAVDALIEALAHVYSRTTGLDVLEFRVIDQTFPYAVQRAVLRYNWKRPGE